MRHTSIIYAFLAVMLFPVVLASCKEESNEVEEYPNWKEQNEATFKLLLDEARSNIAQGRTDYAILHSYAQNEKATYSDDSLIIVQKVENGYDDGKTPLYGDSVVIHMFSRLLPSTSYPNGRVFFKTYTDYTFDLNTSSPAVGVVTEDNFTNAVVTALQYMKEGDHWVVCYPWSLGYGSSYNSTYTVPAYSTIISDIYLLGVFPKGTEVPGWK